jgi:hypothetical protein
MFLSHRIDRVRAIAFGVATLITATAVPLLASDVAAASTASQPAAGTIHLYIVNTSIAGRNPGDVLISGAFADHGTVKGATLHLAKGTITANIAKLEALFNSPKFATGYSASCSFNGAGNVSLPLVRGTGAYAGIKGDIRVHVIFGAQSPFRNGKCDGNSPPIADQQLITGSGNATF